MKRIRLAEKDLTALIKRVIDEQQELNEMFVCASDQECIDATGDSRTRCDLGVGKCYVVGGNPPGMVTTGTNRGKGLQNRGRGEKATDSLRHTKDWSVGGMISEKELGGRCKSPECRGKHAVWSRNPGGRGWFCDCVNGPHIEFEEEQIISLKETQLTNLIKRVVSESQLLTEEIHCLPGTAGTGCGGGKIWCEVESGPGSGTISGCFCRHGNWCDQHGCNPECSGDSTMGPLYPEGDNPLDPKNLKGTEAVRDRGLEIGGGSGFVNQQGDSDRLTRFKGNNKEIGESDLRRLVKRVISEKKKEKKKEKVEKGKGECWVCANWGNHRDHFYCEKQQRDSSGNCDGYSSSDKCRRKCAKVNNVSINQVGVKIGNKIIPGNKVNAGKGY